LSLAPYLAQNLSLSISALNFLKISYKTADFKDSSLFGRLTNINDHIIVDVGHNVLAASTIVSALSGNKYIIIYNSYKDKNYKKVLEILKPIIKYVEIIDISGERVENKAQLKKVLNDLEIEYSMFKSRVKNTKYLVFGSFGVIEAFMVRNLKHE